jgi:hypothetical protein
VVQFGGSRVLCQFIDRAGDAIGYKRGAAACVSRVQASRCSEIAGHSCSQAGQGRTPPSAPIRSLHQAEGPPMKLGTLCKPQRHCCWKSTRAVAETSQRAKRASLYGRCNATCCRLRRIPLSRPRNRPSEH